jgi:hypothetical protein
MIDPGFLVMMIVPVFGLGALIIVWLLARLFGNAIRNML